MCLAVPGRILVIAGDDLLTRIGNVAFAGIVKEVSLTLVPEAAVDDYVLVHAGFAIAVLNEAEAQRTIDYLNALAATTGRGEPRP